MIRALLVPSPKLLHRRGHSATLSALPPLDWPSRVQLRDVPGDLYGAANTRNEVVVRIQPDPAIFMKMTVKQPGSRAQVEQSELELEYVRSYAESAATLNEAYERLILDALLGDQQHFVRRDELRRAAPGCRSSLQLLASAPR